MRFVLSVGLAIAVATAATGCSSRSEAEACDSLAAIVEGTTAPPSELAANGDSVVAVLVVDPADGTSVLDTCTGVRLDASHIVTARHCVSSTPASSIRIVAGPASVAGNRCVAAAAPSRKEATAVATSATLDLAVILTAPSDGSSTPGCTRLPSVGTAGVIAGYGLSEGGELGVRRFLKTEVVGTSTDVIAVQAPTAAGACVGDSGGPLFVKEDDRWCVAGTLSTGSADCRGLDRYQSVTAASEWILSLR